MVITAKAIETLHAVSSFIWITPKAVSAKSEPVNVLELGHLSSNAAAVFSTLPGLLVRMRPIFTNPTGFSGKTSWTTGRFTYMWDFMMFVALTSTMPTTSKSAA